MTRARILQAVRDGTLTAASPLTEVPGIGPYLARRLATGAGGGTVGALWNATQGRTTAQVTKTLERALQNERGNQCVSPRTRRSPGATYHTGDINERGYEACAALLAHTRRGSSAALL